MEQNKQVSEDTKLVIWVLGYGNKTKYLQGTTKEIEKQMKEAEQEKVDVVLWINPNANKQASKVVCFDKNEVDKITKDYQKAMYIANIDKLQHLDESCRVRQALHCVLLAIDFLDTQFYLGVSIDRNTLIKKLNKIYKHVAEHEGINQGKQPIKKETVSSKLITQIFNGSEKFMDALQQYYYTDGADRTLEIEILNHVSRVSRETTSKDIVYVRDRFNEIRELYDLNQ